MDTGERISALCVMAMLLAFIAIQMKASDKLERRINAMEQKAIEVEREMKEKQKSNALALLKCIRDSFAVQCDLNTKMADYIVAVEEKVDSKQKGGRK